MTAIHSVHNRVENAAISVICAAAYERRRERVKSGDQHPFSPTITSLHRRMVKSGGVLCFVRRDFEHYQTRPIDYVLRRPKDIIAFSGARSFHFRQTRIFVQAWQSSEENGVLSRFDLNRPFLNQNSCLAKIRTATTGEREDVLEPPQRVEPSHSTVSTSA